MTVETREQFESRISNSSMVEALKEFFLEHGPHDGYCMDEQSCEYRELEGNFTFSKDSVVYRDGAFTYIFDPETRSVVTILEGEVHTTCISEQSFEEYIRESR